MVGTDGASPIPIAPVFGRMIDPIARRSLQFAAAPLRHPPLTDELQRVNVKGRPRFEELIRKTCTVPAIDRTVMRQSIRTVAHWERDSDSEETEREGERVRAMIVRIALN